MTNKSARALAAQAEPEDIYEDVDDAGNPLPEWTKRYAKPERKLLSWAGEDPDVIPRAHECNLRIIEAGWALDKAAPDLSRTSYRKRLALEIWDATIGMTYARVGIDRVPDYSFEAMQRELAGIEPPALPAARSADEIEVRPDWLTMYPPEYARLLTEHGVPTVAGSQVDDFDRRLIELVPPDCVDEASLQKAAGSAFLYAFAGNWLTPCDDGDDIDDRSGVRAMDEIDQLDLADVCWETYPEQHRPVLQWLGRPDYEHPNAADFNRALIAAALYLQEGGPLDPAALARFRRYLWSAYFPDTPCPA